MLEVSILFTGLYVHMHVYNHLTFVNNSYFISFNDLGSRIFFVNKNNAKRRKPAIRNKFGNMRLVTLLIVLLIPLSPLLASAVTMHGEILSVEHNLQKRTGQQQLRYAGVADRDVTAKANVQPL